MRWTAAGTSVTVCRRWALLMVSTRSAARTASGVIWRATKSSASAPASVRSAAIGGLIGSPTRALVPTLATSTPESPAIPPAAPVEVIGA